MLPRVGKPAQAWQPEHGGACETRRAAPAGSRVPRVPGCRHGSRADRRSPKGGRRKEDAATAPPQKTGPMKRSVFEPVPPDACDSRGVAGKGVPGGRAAGGAARRAVAGWRTAGVRGREGSGETSPGRCAGRPAAGARGSVTLSKGKARRCGPTGTAPAPPEARTYPAGIAGECQSRRGDSVSAGSEVAPGRGAAGRGSEGVPPSRAANRPAILRAGRRYPRRRRRRGRGGMPERLEGARGGNSPRASTRVGSGGSQAARLRPLSAGVGSAG